MGSGCQNGSQLSQHARPFLSQNTPNFSRPRSGIMEPQRPPQPNRYLPPPSKPRPALIDSGLLDGVSFESDPIINFIPLKPTKYQDPYEQLGSVASLIGGNSEDVLDPPDARPSRSAGKNINDNDPVPGLEKVPSFPLPGLGRTSSASSSSLYPISTPRTQTSSGAGSGNNSSGKSSAWSTVSNRVFSDAAPDVVTSTQKEPGLFTKEYDKLARKHGLQPFPVGHMVEPSSVSVSSASVKKHNEEIPKIVVPHGPIGKGTKMLNRFLKRTDSTRDISERSRKTLGHPLGQKKIGVGLNSPGIFRVAGSPNATEALYDYYQRQLGNSQGDSIVQTTSLATLPTHLTYTVNDVAHLFKALLAGLPGGLLGSPAVFQALYSVQSFLFVDPDLHPRTAKNIKPRMIALAIASLNLHFRISLICAVFGLLRCVALSTHGISDEVRITKPAETFTFMKEDALGVIFGPLLLGDKSDHILVPAHEERGGLLVLPTVAPQPDEEPAKGKENVVVQMKKIGALEMTAKMYDMPDLTPLMGELPPAPPSQQKLPPRVSGKKESSGRENNNRRRDPTPPVTEIRNDPRPSSRNNSKSDIRNDGPSSYRSPQPQPPPPKSKSSSLKHVKSFKTLKGTRHSTKTSKASDMNDLTMPPHLVGEQDLIDAGETPTTTQRPSSWRWTSREKQQQRQKEEMSSGMEDMSSLDLDLDFSKSLKEEAVAQSLHEGKHISAAKLVGDIDAPVVLLEVPGEVGSKRGGDNGGSSSRGVNGDGGGAGGDLMIDFEERDGGGAIEGSLLVSDSIKEKKNGYKQKNTEAPYIAATKSNGTEALLKDPDLVALLGMDEDRNTTPTPAENRVVRVPETGYSSSDSGVQNGNNKRSFSGKAQGLRVTPSATLQSPQQTRPNNDLEVTGDQGKTPVLTLTRPGSDRTIKIPRGGGNALDQVDKKLLEVTVPKEPMSGTEAEDEFRTPPLGDITPRPPLDSGGGLATPKSVHEEYALSIHDSDFEDRLSFEKRGDGGKSRNGNGNINNEGIDVVNAASPPPPPPASQAGQQFQSQTQTQNETSTAIVQRTTSTSSTYQPTLPLEMRSNTALYAEIRRLTQLVDVRTEEAKQSRRELDLARKMANAGTLSQLLRDAKEESKVWRNRAEWAEKKLREMMMLGASGGGGGYYVQDGGGGGGREDDNGGGWDQRDGEGGREREREREDEEVLGRGGKRVGSWGVGMEREVIPVVNDVHHGGPGKRFGY
ncbi:hypothetical protein DFH27DRAFT_520561 [Peziza echinospora]|nr:hypothetical protein DFH27DRAFT_520561 [Peziza echinospora]